MPELACWLAQVAAEKLRRLRVRPHPRTAVGAGWESASLLGQQQVSESAGASGLGSESGLGLASGSRLGLRLVLRLELTLACGSELPAASETQWRQTMARASGLELG